VVVVAAGVLGVPLMSDVAEPEAPMEVPLPVALPVVLAAVSVLGVAGAGGVTVVDAVVSVEGVVGAVLEVVDVSVVTSFLLQAAMDRLRAAIRARAAQRATVFSCMGSLQVVCSIRGIGDEGTAWCLLLRHILGKGGCRPVVRHGRCL
jgi:hypothetical protein